MILPYAKQFVYVKRTQIYLCNNFSCKINLPRPIFLMLLTPSNAEIINGTKLFYSFTNKYEIFSVPVGKASVIIR